MKMRLTSLTVIAVFMSVRVLGPLGVEAEAQEYQVRDELEDIPVEGALASGGTFVGELTILGFTVLSPSTLSVTGVLDGTATSIEGTETDVKKQPFTAFVTSFGFGSAEPGVCDILFLEIGPISLNLLGLTIELSEILLDVDAVPGEGNLLGNLLCAIVNLLNQ